MIRSKEPDVRLFYGSEELYRPSQTGYYSRLNRVVGSWASLCAPLQSAFHEGKNGRPVDPVVYFKIFLVGYLEGIVFDTDLAERIGDSLSVREFVGYGPTERTPDHSSLSRARSALCADGLLEQVMCSVVGMCARAGMVEAREVAVDSTLLPANASLSSLRSVKTGVGVKEHLARLREEGKPLAVSNEEFRSTSDPDARIAKKGPSRSRGMYHKATHVTDSKSQVILAAGVETADVSDPAAALAPLACAQKVLEQEGLSLERVVFDAGYDDSNLHAHVEQMNAVPVANYQQTPSPKTQGFTKADFVYDHARDIYICPNGAALRRHGHDGDRVQYRSRPTVCAQCPLRSSCLDKGRKHRSVGRSPNEAARDRNIARCHTDEGRAALKRRKTVVEPPFAHMKRFGGLRLVNCRSRGRVQAKVTIAAIAWNLMKLVGNAGKDLLLSILNQVHSLIPVCQKSFQLHSNRTPLWATKTIQPRKLLADTRVLRLPV